MFVDITSGGPNHWGTWVVKASHGNAAFYGEADNEILATQEAIAGIARVCNVALSECVYSRIDRQESLQCPDLLEKLTD